jgi:hypothetical protein
LPGPAITELGRAVAGEPFWRGLSRDGGYMPGEAEADTDGHLWPIAVSRLPAAAETSRSALTVADTALALGLEVRFDTAVWSLSSAADRALVWDCHWPCACVVSVFSFALTSARSDLISSPVPCPTWTWVRVSIEARRAAASWHTADVEPGAADEAAADDGAAEVVDGLLPLDGVPLDPQAAASSAAPAATATACHREGLIAVTRLMRPASSTVGRRSSPARGYLAG